MNHFEIRLEQFTVLRGLAKLVPGLGEPAAQRFGGHGNRRQGIVDFVCDPRGEKSDARQSPVAQQLSAAFFDFPIQLFLVVLKSFDHAVEDVRQIDHFVAAAQFTPAAVVAVGHPRSGLMQLPNRNEDPVMTTTDEKNHQDGNAKQAAFDPDQLGFENGRRFAQCSCGSPLGIGDFLDQGLNACDIADHRLENAFAVRSGIQSGLRLFQLGKHEQDLIQFEMHQIRSG